MNEKDKEKFENLPHRNGAFSHKQSENFKEKMLKKGMQKGANIIVPGSGEIIKKVSESQTAQNIYNRFGDFKTKTPFLNPLVNKKNKENKESQGKGILTDDLGKKIIKYTAFSFFTGGGCFSLILVVLIAFIILSPIIYFNDFKNNSNEFIEELGNFLTFRGWCTDEECKENEEVDFYKEIDKVYEDYYDKYNVQLNKSLIVATLTYDNPFITGSGNDKIEENEDGDFDLNSHDFDSSNMIDFKKSKEKVRLLAKNMVTKNSNGYYIDIENYKKFLGEKFIKKFYFNDSNNPDINDKIESVIKEIFDRVAFINGTEDNLDFKVYAVCPGVHVVSEDEKIDLGTYDLETYVAGVVRHEMANIDKFEALKAQAVVARTYTLAVTNNCQNPIKNSLNVQMATINDDDDLSKKAAKDTEGTILVNGEYVFASQYDSFCTNKSCKYHEENGKLVSEYTKLPNHETHKVYLDKKYKKRITKGGHGQGMSQVMAFQMSDEGKSYEDILTMFYSPTVDIVKMHQFVGQFSSFKEPPKSVDEIKERSQLYAKLGRRKIGNNYVDLSVIYSGFASNLAQCVWYARSRALEIIYFSDMDDKRKYEAFTAISETKGHGGEWYSKPPLPDFFDRNNDPFSGAPGSIISWKSFPSRGADHSYGHVAIVEQIDKDGIYISEGWKSKNKSGWASVNYSYKKIPFSRVEHYKPAYDLNGFVYLLGKGE